MTSKEQRLQEWAARMSRRISGVGYGGHRYFPPYPYDWHINVGRRNEFIVSIDRVLHEMIMFQPPGGEVFIPSSEARSIFYKKDPPK